MALFQHHTKKGSLLSQLALLLVISSPFAYATNKILTVDSCHPPVDVNQSQYIVGYGSLIQERSKREDASDIGDNQPIYITGFNRSWIMYGTRGKLNTTYLAVVKKNAAKMNAVYFKLNNPKEISNYDEREYKYCRAIVSPQQIKTISTTVLPTGQYWVYITKDDDKTLPSTQYPILQSYVDIFLSGCLEQEEKHHLQNFAHDCIKMTSGWSRHWVNDRAVQANPSKNAPYTKKVDALIAKELPVYFKEIKIERVRPVKP